MKQISHYRFIGDFSVITVRHIKWVVFPFANISSKWFTLIGIADFFIGCSVLSNEFLDERIRTRRVVRRVREFDDGLVSCDGESLDIADSVDVRAGKLPLLHGLSAVLYSDLTMMRRFSGSLPAT